MTENKRFELYINPNTNCFDIMDKVESQEKKAICIYNDLGVQYFSSAPALCDLLNTLYDENEELKQALKDYHNVFDCSQCRYHNYDWFSDGDEFEVCDKGNNEAQMYYHSCKDWEEL